jgi:hypothetical protein
LASLCSLSEDSVYQNKDDLENDDFINSYLLPEVEIQSKVNATVEFFKNNASTRIISLVNYLRTTMRANYLVSGLNTNFLIEISNNGNDYALFRKKISIENAINSGLKTETVDCRTRNPLAPISFITIPDEKRYRFHYDTYLHTLHHIFVSGFFAGCTPLEALLQSTLDCLYSTECIQLLMHWFPNITQVCMILFHLYYIYFYLDTHQLDRFCSIFKAR